jgi:type IV pilus assembly protein PilY1
MFLVAVTMWGQAVITLPGGQVSLGVAIDGQLGAGSLPATSNVPGGKYGIYLASQNADGIAPGCFCEGWGASANGVSGYAANDNGNANTTHVSFTSTATTATTVTTLASLPALQITQAFAPAAGAPTALFQDTVTLTNTGSTTLNDVRYARALDWDINPTEFNEIVTIQGLPASALLFSNDDGFCTPDPVADVTTSACPDEIAGTDNTNFVKVGPIDQGSFFVFKFGNLAPGASASFIIYFGAANNESLALAALTGVKAGLYTLGYSNIGGVANVNSGVWMFAFNGVGGTAPTGGGTTVIVPTLSEWGLILLALLMMAAAARLFRRTSAKR